jgi:Phage integrase family
MGRPPLPVGTFGRIDFHHNGEERVRARASFRDVDGVRRPVTRWGSSAQQAEARLRAALACRAGPAVGALSAQTRVADAARVWLAQVDGSGRASGTRSLYRAAVRGYVVPAMGELRLGELTVPLIERALAVVLSGHGSGAARTARAALSGICSMAARHGAVPTNPVRDTAPIRQGRKPVRALTVTEAADHYGWVTSHTFRKTVATRLDEAGMSARQIADQLGHSRPSMTLDVYLGRQRSVNRAAAAVLDRAAAGRGFIDRKLFVSCS